jgi:hypothetical protein
MPPSHTSVRESGSKNNKHKSPSSNSSRKRTSSAERRGKKSRKAMLQHMEWVLKYQPTSIRKLAGDRAPHRQLTTWLKDFEQKRKELLQNVVKNVPELSQTKKGGASKKSKQRSGSGSDGEESEGGKKGKKPPLFPTTAIVSGEHGVGKTLCVNLILREAGYIIRQLNLGQLHSKKEGDLARYLNDLLGEQNIITLMNNEKQPPTAIVVDNIEAITGKHEREGLQMVHKYNEKHHLFPLVIISNANHSKLLAKVKKDNNLLVTIQRPDYNSMQELVERISKSEGFSISNSRQLILNSQGDFRRLINQLEELRRIYPGKDKIGDTLLSEFCNTMEKKDTNIGLFDQTKSLLYMFPGVEEVHRWFNSDKVILPLMLQENYLDSLSSRKDMLGLSEEECLRAHAEISESISMGDIVENHVHGEQAWQLTPAYGHFSCAYPSWYINRWQKPYSGERLVYVQDMNKVYISRINGGHIRTMKPYFGDRTLQGYLTVGKIAFKMILDGNEEGLKKLFGGYSKISSVIIEALLKINKIANSTKVNLKREKRNKLLTKCFGSRMDISKIGDAQNAYLMDGDDADEGGE